MAIELDDKTHEKEDRIIRDREVERMLATAGIALKRFPVSRDYNKQDIKMILIELLNKR